MKIEITLERFRELLTQICDRETSQDPKGWTPENPLWGHCAVVSLIAQNIFGGEILRASLAEVPGFEHMRSHYLNRFQPNQIEDFTKSQFLDHYPSGLKTEVLDHSSLLSFPETAKRYKLLAFRLARLLVNGGKIFQSVFYQHCFELALDSPCQKMKFGSVLVYNNDIVCAENNHFIESLKHFCEPTCVRLNLQSRTESMLGACGHAEEFVIWNAVSLGIPLDQCDLYIAGIYPNGLPWLKTEAEHTCLRCSVQMYFAKVRTIYVPHIDHWAGLSTDQAISGSIAYAMKSKKV